MNQIQIVFEITNVNNFGFGVELDSLEAVVEHESVGGKRTVVSARINPDESSNVIGSQSNVHRPLGSLSNIDFAHIDDLESRPDKTICMNFYPISLHTKKADFPFRKTKYLNRSHLQVADIRKRC